MEVLLFALFFISALVFFIVGKDDFGRTESKLTINDEETDKEKEEVKVADKGKGNIASQQETVKDKEEVKVADKGKGNIASQKETKKDS